MKLEQLAIGLFVFVLAAGLRASADEREEPTIVELGMTDLGALSPYVPVTLTPEALVRQVPGLAAPRRLVGPANLFLTLGATRRGTARWVLRLVPGEEWRQGSAHEYEFRFEVEDQAAGVTWIQGRLRYTLAATEKLWTPWWQEAHRADGEARSPASAYVVIEGREFPTVVYQHGIAVGKMRVSNQSKEPVVLDRIQASCACVFLQDAKALFPAPLDPGQFIDVPLEYRAGARRGRGGAYVRLHGRTANGNPVVLGTGSLAFQVAPAFSFDRNPVVLGSAEPQGDQQVQTVRIVRGGPDLDWDSIAVHDVRGVRCVVKTHGIEQPPELVISVEAGVLAPGRHVRTLYVDISGGDHKYRSGLQLVLTVPDLR